LLRDEVGPVGFSIDEIKIFEVGAFCLFKMPVFICSSKVHIHSISSTQVFWKNFENKFAKKKSVRSF
jgi:hypothetical protein